MKKILLVGVGSVVGAALVLPYWFGSQTEPSFKLGTEFIQEQGGIRTHGVQR